MADRRSALANLHAAPARDSARVVLTEVRPASIIQVAAWPDTLPRVEAALGELLDIATPAAGAAIANDATTIAAIGAGRFWIASNDADLPSRLEAGFLAADAAVTDISHGRAILRLDGEAAADVLSRCVAIDLDPAVFPPGRVAQTMIHHIDVLVHRTRVTSFELWVLRSFAESLAEWVLDTGTDVGARFSRTGPA